MSDFSAFLELGFQHITDIQGYDHILYLLITCGLFTFKDSKKILWMITGFTVGHSITLAISVLNTPPIPSAIVEWLIAFTIFSSALYQLYSIRKNEPSFPKWMYGMTTLFGLIHGMGFSTLLRSLLGKQVSIIVPLLGFNLGLEAGQLFIVFTTILLSSICIDKFKLQPKMYKLIISVPILIISAWMMVQRMI